MADYPYYRQPDELLRVRGWVLVETDTHDLEAVQELAMRLWLELGREGGGNWVVVRADVVYGECPYNIIIPVDTANDTQLNAVVNEIRDRIGPTVRFHVARIVYHNPWPPQNASSFIPAGEEDEAWDNCKMGGEGHIGRQPQTPGGNPHG